MTRVIGEKQVLRKVKKLGNKIVGRSMLGLKNAQRFAKRKAMKAGDQIKKATIEKMM